MIVCVRYSYSHSAIVTTPLFSFQSHRKLLFEMLVLDVGYFELCHLFACYKYNENNIWDSIEIMKILFSLCWSKWNCLCKFLQGLRHICRKVVFFSKGKQRKTQFTRWKRWNRSKRKKVKVKISSAPFSSSLYKYNTWNRIETRWIFKLFLSSKKVSEIGCLEIARRTLDLRIKYWIIVMRWLKFDTK